MTKKLTIPEAAKALGLPRSTVDIARKLGPVTEDLWEWSDERRSA